MASVDAWIRSPMQQARPMGSVGRGVLDGFVWQGQRAAAAVFLLLSPAPMLASCDVSDVDGSDCRSFVGMQN